jgi:hypothetical protein
MRALGALSNAMSMSMTIASDALKLARSALSSAAWRRRKSSFPNPLTLSHGRGSVAIVDAD